MATTSQIRQLQTPDNLVDVYPLTLEDAVFDGNGVQLSTKIHDLENRPLWNPKGTCTFANLPALSTAQVGDMWNISDQFTTTSDFREGAGIVVPAGSNVYKTTDGKWDILTGSAVVGVKGNAEQNYRAGDVNITLQNLGYDVENDLLATVPGYVLDARQGRVISGSILSVSGRVDQTLSDIAPVEPNATSTRAYTVGKYLVYNNRLYKVIQAIAIGDALTVGTNIEETKVVNEMGSGGSSGGGHTILNTSGTAMAQRSNLQFEGFEVSDNANDNKTVVKNSDVSEATLTYTSKDIAANTTAKTNTTTNQPSTVAQMASGETVANLFGKVSAFFASVRKLWNTVGTTAVSSDKTLTELANILVPIGVILPLMGKSAPTGYLNCDGKTYNISAYPALANYFNAQFGSKNYFGGNGTTTFAVPNLQGEFLRGAGTNGHTNQGNGGSVGVHQDGTVIKNFWATDALYCTKDETYGVTNPDSLISNPTSKIKYIETNESTSNATNYTSRPTNTSVLYIIKAFA